MPALAIASLVLGGIGTGMSVFGGLKAGKAAKQEEAHRASLEKLRAKRERVQQIRQARIQRAEILQQGENAGAGESSSVATGAAGTFAQAFSNISYINQQESIGRGITAARTDQIAGQGLATLGKGMQDVGGMIFANQKNIQDVFGGETPT